MRLLVTCGGEKSIKVLSAILDDRDAQCAVYAAWVLAQLPDKAAAAVAVRRVAIFGMFHHEIYQQGAGIDFVIAPDLYFHQATERLNPDPIAHATGEGTVRIPASMLAPFPLNAAEQQYAIRCYRQADAAGSPHGTTEHLLATWQVGANWPSPPQRQAAVHESYLPLLRVIASEDSRVKPLMVKGQVVAHFQYRQLAAKAIVAIAKKRAVYRGLAGETLDSEAFPSPYLNQNQLLAKYFVDRVEKARLPQTPESGPQWEQVNTHQAAAFRLDREFGSKVLDAIRQEAERRGINLAHIFPPGTY